jgi:hypothetical protein
LGIISKGIRGLFMMPNSPELDLQRRNVASIE